MAQSAEQLITTIRNNVPRVLQEQAAWRTWKKFTPAEGHAIKLPLCLTERGWRSVKGQSGHDLSTAAPLSVAEKGLRAGQGEGLGISINPELGWVGLDLDWKGWVGRTLDQVIADAEAAGKTLGLDDLKTCAAMGVGAMPWPAALTMAAALENGAYVEWSPSGQGAHALIPGTAPEGHNTRGTLSDGMSIIDKQKKEVWASRKSIIANCIYHLMRMDRRGSFVTKQEKDDFREWRSDTKLNSLNIKRNQIGVEFYSDRRWFTVTGLSVTPGSVEHRMEVTKKTSEMIEQLANRVCGKKAPATGPQLESGSMPRLSDVKILTAAQLPGQFGQRIRASADLTHLWDDPSCSDRSKRDHRIARTIQETEGMTPEQGWALFNACPAVQRAKFDAMHGTQTYGQRTWARAAAQGFGPKQEALELEPSAAAAWTPTQINRLRSGLIGALMEPGRPMNRNRLAALGDLLVWIAEQAVTRGAKQDGPLMWVSLGTVTAMTCEVPGQFAAVQERLNDLWRAGLLLGLERDSTGRVIVALPVDPAAHPCVKKVQSRTRKGLILDLTPSVREQGKKKAAAPQEERSGHLDAHLSERDLAVMDAALSGKRSPTALASRLALPVDAVRASLARLEAAGHIRAGKPTLTHAQWMPVKREARRERRLASLNYRRARIAVWRSAREAWARSYSPRVRVSEVTQVLGFIEDDSVYDAIHVREQFISTVRGGRV